MATYLLRLALEQGLRKYWSRVRPELNRCSVHARMLCLEGYAGPQVAHRCAAVWASLSQACRNHAYELSPTPGELRAWREKVAAILSMLFRQEM